MRVDEHTIEVAGLPVFYRSAPATATATLFLHGVPTSSEDFSAVLELTGGIAPDLPGFGRSGKGGHLDYSIGGFADVLEQLLEALSIERFQLVGHSWGAAAGLELVRRNPARAARIVLCNPLPLAPGFEWPRIVRRMRRRGVGELTMGFTTKWLLARAIRRGCVRAEAFSEQRIDSVWAQFDQGTQRALLLLHRSIDESQLAAAGERLGQITAPTLIVWGERDPWLSAALGDEMAHRFPDASVRHLPDAGHWPWLDQPELVASIASFLGVG